MKHKGPFYILQRDGGFYLREAIIGASSLIAVDAWSLERELALPYYTAAGCAVWTNRLIPYFRRIRVQCSDIARTIIPGNIWIGEYLPKGIARND